MLSPALDGALGPLNGSTGNPFVISIIRRMAGPRRVPGGLMCKKRLWKGCDRVQGFETFNEAPHGSFKATETISLSLLKSFLVLPVVVADAVTCQHGSGAIRAAAAVDEHRPTLTVLQQAQDLRNLLQCRRTNALHRDADKAHPVGLDNLLLVR